MHLTQELIFCIQRDGDSTMLSPRWHGVLSLWPSDPDLHLQLYIVFVWKKWIKIFTTYYSTALCKPSNTRTKFWHNRNKCQSTLEANMSWRHFNQWGKLITHLKLSGYFPFNLAQDNQSFLTFSVVTATWPLALNGIIASGKRWQG